MSSGYGMIIQDSDRKVVISTEEVSKVMVANLSTNGWSRPSDSEKDIITPTEETISWTVKSGIGYALIWYDNIPPYVDASGILRQPAMYQSARADGSLSGYDSRFYKIANVPGNVTSFGNNTNIVNGFGGVLFQGQGHTATSFQDLFSFYRLHTYPASAKATQTLISFGDELLLVWITDDLTKPENNRTSLVFSKYAGDL